MTTKETKETADAREARIFRLFQRSEKRANALKREAEGLQERVSALREALIELEGSYEHLRATKALNADSALWDAMIANRG